MTTPRLTRLGRGGTIRATHLRIGCSPPGQGFSVREWALFRCPRLSLKWPPALPPLFLLRLERVQPSVNPGQTCVQLPRDRRDWGWNPQSGADLSVQDLFRKTSRHFVSPRYETSTLAAVATLLVRVDVGAQHGTNLLKHTLDSVLPKPKGMVPSHEQLPVFL
jgi:hypothetical protein